MEKIGSQKQLRDDLEAKKKELTKINYNLKTEETKQESELINVREEPNRLE